MFLAGLGVALMAISARAEITGGVMAIKGAEMS
jgi:hypothetical protein